MEASAQFTTPSRNEAASDCNSTVTLCYKTSKSLKTHQNIKTYVISDTDLQTEYIVQMPKPGVNRIYYIWVVPANNKKISLWCEKRNTTSNTILYSGSDNARQETTVNKMYTLNQLLPIDEWSANSHKYAFSLFVNNIRIPIVFAHQSKISRDKRKLNEQTT